MEIDGGPDDELPAPPALRSTPHRRLFPGAAGGSLTGYGRGIRPMAPFVVLMALPVLIGIVSELYFRDTKNASLAAAVGSVLNVCLCVQVLAPEGGWSWLAALLVSPLPVAFAVAAVFICYGRSNRHRRTDG